MDKKLEDALTKQIGAEFYSGYLYLQMAAWFEENNLKGCAHWMRIQAQEEACHALIMFNYMVEAGAKITLGKIEAPQASYKSMVDVFAATLKHEKGVTAGVHNLIEMAADLKDHATRIMLEWFVKEQVEEEANATELLEKAKIIGDQPNAAMFMLDAALANRSFSVPSPLKG